MCGQGEVAPTFQNLGETTTPTCELCPFPARCPEGAGCAQGAKGVGCSECQSLYFALSGECAQCPEGASLELPIALGIVAVVIIGVCIWKLSATPEVVDEAEGARGNAEAAVQAHGHVNNAVAFAGIAAFHFQLSAIKLSLPGFPFPPALRAIARWIDNLIGFDLGELASPECQNTDLRGYDSLAIKTGLINATFVVLMLALWLAGKRSGRRNHARNAMLATYTLMLTVLAKAHVRWIDCTDGMFDAAPDEPCDFRGPLQASPILIYFVLVPVLIRSALRRDTKLPCCTSKEGEPFNHDASYGWITRKYAPSCRWFELIFLAYKAAAVFACGESSVLSLLSPPVHLSPSASAGAVH